MKTCRECGETKADGAFYPKRLVCKVCFHKARGSQPIGRPRKSPVDYPVCSRCGLAKPASEFRKGSYRTGAVTNLCKVCASVARKEKRALDSDRNARWVLAYLRAHPCVDCGETDPIVLEFDHVRGRKEANVATLQQGGMALARLQREVAKCDVRCRNCHIRRHALAENWRIVRLLRE